MGQIWRVLQATVQWCQGLIWLAYKLPTGKQKHGWVVQCCQHHDIFWFFMKDEDFVSRAINEGSGELEKFSASKVHQLAKKLESSKAMTRHIMQVAGDLQAAQFNLICHQCTELSTGKNKKKEGFKPKQYHPKNGENAATGQFKRSFWSQTCTQVQR